ncbi:MAG: hypothetical protein Q8S84_00835 [bacterium]|nr:hypothetical protein [bacterium]
MLENQFTTLSAETANSILQFFTFGSIFSLSLISNQLLGISIEIFAVSFFTNHEEVVASLPPQETKTKIIDTKAKNFLIIFIYKDII